MVVMNQLIGLHWQGDVNRVYSTIDYDEITMELSYHVTDVARDKAGQLLTNVRMSLFENLGDGVFVWRQTTVSDSTTGVYDFVVSNSTTDYMVYAHIAGTPDRYDATNNNLRGVAQ